MYTGSAVISGMNNKQARQAVIEWMRGKGGKSAAAMRFFHFGADKKAELLQAAKDGRLDEMEKPECKISKAGSQGVWRGRA